MVSDEDIGAGGISPPEQRTLDAGPGRRAGDDPAPGQKVPHGLMCQGIQVYLGNTPLTPSGEVYPRGFRDRCDQVGVVGLDYVLEIHGGHAVGAQTFLQLGDGRVVEVVRLTGCVGDDDDTGVAPAGEVDEAVPDLRDHGTSADDDEGALLGAVYRRCARGGRRALRQGCEARQQRKRRQGDRSFQSIHIHDINIQDSVQGRGRRGWHCSGTEAPNSWSW